MRLAKCAGVAVVLLTAGCIHLEQTLMLNGDGSLMVRYHYSIAEESSGLMTAGRHVVEQWQGKVTTAKAEWFTSEAAVRRHFAKPGVRLQQFRSFSEGGRRHIEILVFAEDGPGAINRGVFGAFCCERGPDKTVLLKAELPNVPEILAEADDQAMEALCDDLYLRLEFKVPGRITTSTAPKSARRSATWEFDPTADTDFLRRMPQISCRFPASRFSWADRLPKSTD